MNFRRVVTGHDKNGKPVVRIDDRGQNTADWRPHMTQQQLWTTRDLPVDLNENGEDQGARDVGSMIPGGSIFKIVEFGPGVAPRSHRTDSIDYAIVISGEIDMEMGEGKSVHLCAGDTLVQRATIHNWINRGEEPCVIAFVLISAQGNTAVG
ncbi:cupin domain-containing protein [Microbulbifer sp. OS29]|uniref:Cupin domain-containing protein n=1 Tax=Microbulbifer okhotskensis TaxID=2926617 RepID=A0A9X2J5D4_9GAMM|nr:cupin domain-containing protein [Microbulbifer okhotskensis]MCO1335427.1 cupin domain-containing protein [Microbulbifer okhotskensis]